MNYTNTLFFSRFAATELSTHVVWKTFVAYKNKEKEMKNNIYTSMIFTILLTSLSADAGAEDTVVDKSVKYGEKYSCVIITTDAKNYTLDIEWHAEPAKYSPTPKWEDKLIYTLKENGETTDNGYFSDLGFGGRNTELVFNYDKYVFSASASQSTRVGTNYHDVAIEMTKSFDNNGKVVLAVASFNSSHSYDRYYGSTKAEAFTLDIASSVCAVIPISKD